MNIRAPLIPFAGSLLALSLVTACSNDGHSSGNDTSSPSSQEHKLRKVGSAAELEAYLKAGLKQASDNNGSIATLGIAPAAPTPPVDSAADGNADPTESLSFSNTTLIEQGIDEADIVKSDGDVVYIAEASNGYCVELCQPIQAMLEGDIAAGEYQPEKAEGGIRVMRVSDLLHWATEIAHIHVPHSAEHDYQSVAGLLLTDDSDELISITNASSNVYDESLVPDQWSSIWAWSYGSTIVDTFDVSNPAAAVHENRIEIDGYLLQTRRIDNTLYLVTRFTPEVVITGTTQARDAEIDALTLAEMLPQVSVNGDRRTLVSPDNCFVDKDATGYPTLMVVTAVNLDDSSLQSSCVTANAYGFYMSSNALYITQAEWNQQSNETTHIYKFSLSGEGPSYRGEGSAEGSPTGNYNFSISEHEDVLRLATVSWNELGPVNELHTFAESANGDLEALATLPNSEHPESLGKAGETIQGIRFVGDRAYVVTFLQTDPLYVVDLSNPADPFIAGQVEIPGFSTLLQPLDNDLLLGVGRENNRLKVELYDVQNPSAPQSVSKYLMSPADEDGGSYSTAAWEHRALALLPVDNSIRVALPFYRYTYGDGYTETQGALSFSIDLANRSLADVAESDASSDQYIYGEQRVLLQPNTLHYLQGSKIWSSIWGSSEPMLNPQ